MPVRYRRIAVAAVLTAVGVAIPAAAFASSPSTPPAKQSTKPASSPTALKSKPAAGASGSAAASPGLDALASSAGISQSQLDAGLMAAKRVGGNDAAGITAFARATDVPDATAQRIVTAVFGSQRKAAASSMTGPSAAAALAAGLGVTASAAQHALQRLSELSGPDGVDPASTAFAAIAHQLGVSPARLAAALGEVKKSVAGQ
jgi:hypothetical protein